MSAEFEPHWDVRLMTLAAQIGGWSKDRSARTGCVIVGPDRLIRSTGFNGFLRGIDDDVAERHERPAKYSWTEHAERNAIYNAARLGISLLGCTAYVNWFPCVDCARGLAQAGVSTLVALTPDHTDARWGAEFTLATAMLEEAGVAMRLMDATEFSARF